MNKKVLIIVIIAVVVIAAAVLFWPKDPKKQLAKAYGTNPDTNGPATGDTPVAQKVNTPAKTISPVTDIFGMMWNPQAKIPATVDNTVYTQVSPTDFMKRFLPASAVSFIPNPAKFPVKKGSKGNEVKILQSYINADIILNKKKATQLVVDGDFGAKTDQALRKIVPAGQISLQNYTGVILPFVSNLIK